MRKPWGLFWIGMILIAGGCLLASAVQTSGGIRIQDVRFTGTNATPMSALLYVPPNATPQSPAPGILAVHGYINSREVQDGFAIEFARRGYVVLALDQTGHGYSAPPAFSHGFGGPDGLKYLLSLDIVDKANIGLEGHSMGGWAVVNAAAAFPDGYRAMVLEGSSTGPPFAPQGTPAFPRNLAVVFSRHDEFSQLMWGVPTAREVASSPKLWKLFGVEQPVMAGTLYGSIQNGTARTLYTPSGTHPMDHISTTAIGDSVDWFQRTLRGGTARAVSDQIWYWKEIGTLVALIGFVVLVLGTFDVLLQLPLFAPLRSIPATDGNERSVGWWIRLLLGALLPVLTLFAFFQFGDHLVPASRLFPQAITNEIICWALLNGLILFAGTAIARIAAPRFNNQVGRSLGIALLTMAVAYVVTAAVDFLFKVDFRFWFVGVKLLSLTQARSLLAYLLPFTIFFLLLLGTLHKSLAVRDDNWVVQYLANVVALAGGFAILLLVEYGLLFSTGRLLTFYANDTLRTIISIQFLPLMTIVAIVSTFTFRRTNSYLTGALLCGLFVTWYVVAGQATQV